MNDLSNDLKLYQKGDVLFCEGEDPSFLYIVASGSVKLFSGDEKNFRLVKNIGEKDFFGEQALFSEEKRLLTAIVAEDSEIASVKKEDIFEVLDLCPKWMGDVIKLVGKRLRATNNAIYEHQLLDNAVVEDLQLSPDDFAFYKNQLADYKSKLD